MSKAKLRYSSDGTTLAHAVAMIKSAMQFVDGSATVTFKIDHSGRVTAFRLVNNHDDPEETL